jgi:hypothetical protein
MQFHKVVLSAAFLSGCLYLALHRKVDAQNLADPVLDIFDNRALKPHTKPSTGPDPVIVAKLQNSVIGKAYNAIRPERSLLIYDCGKGSSWCGQPYFSFQAIFSEAAKLANGSHPDPDGLAVAWYNSACGLDKVLPREGAQFTMLKDAPFQLLAIANRMDLANFDGQKWTGAEIHFVYGLTPAPQATGPQDLMVIMEFELPAYDRLGFTKLAQAWSGLSAVAAPQYFSQLLGVLQVSGLSLGQNRPTKAVRVHSRLNHAVMAGVWRLSQLLLDPAAPTPAERSMFSPAKLDDQIKKKVQQDSRLYLDLWNKVEGVVQSGVLQYAVPDELLENPSVSYEHLPQSMGTPPGVCKASEEARNVLALQQCTWCHTTESHTLFAHIPNRLPNASSVPSVFLAGQDPQHGSNLHPSLVDLYYGEPTVVDSNSFTYTTYEGAGSPCGTAVTKQIVRKFHDVARRTLFLAAVQTDTAHNNGRPSADPFSTSFPE